MEELYDELAGDNPDFGFFFRMPDGNNYQATANALRDIIAYRPEAKSFKLEEVWCLQSGNLVWACDGYYHDGPWVDPVL